MRYFYFDGFKPFPRFVSKAGKNCLFDTGIYVLANQVAWFSHEL